MSKNTPDTPQTTDAPDSGPIVTAILPVSDQIGRHVMTALQRPETVAVLTTVVPGVDADRVVSLPLTEDQMDEVRGLLGQIQAEDEEAAADTDRCIGFQCQVTT
jgi:hypothetical protein